MKILSPSSTRGRPIQQIRASRNAWPVATPKPNGDGTATPERERSFTAKQHSRTLLNSDATKEKVEVGPVQSVDQLFAQAASASVLLRRKAQQAALASNGAFPVSPRPAFRGPEGEAQQFMTLRDMQLAGVPLGPEGHEEDEERERDEGEEELPREEEQGGGQGALAVQWTDIKPSKRVSCLLAAVLRVEGFSFRVRGFLFAGLRVCKGRFRVSGLQSPRLLISACLAPLAGMVSRARHLSFELRRQTVGPGSLSLNSALRFACAGDRQGAEAVPRRGAPAARRVPREHHLRGHPPPFSRSRTPCPFPTCSCSLVLTERFLLLFCRTSSESRRVSAPWHPTRTS